MVNWDVANARVSGFSTFLGGVALVALLLSINILSGRPRNLTPVVVGGETLTLLFFLAAMVLFFSSTVVLVSAYTDRATEIERSVKLARTFIGTGVVLTFWGVGSVLLVAFELTVQAFSYSLAAVVASIAFVVIRSRFVNLRQSPSG